jgi:hypothetical protein
LTVPPLIRGARGDQTAVPHKLEICCNTNLLPNDGKQKQQLTTNMSEINYLLNDTDVISTPASALMFQSTFTLKELVDIMQSRIAESELFSEGWECQLLTPGKDWETGKVKIRFEFVPHQSDIENNNGDGELEDFGDISKETSAVNVPIKPINPSGGTSVAGSNKPVNQPLGALPDSVLELMPQKNVGMWS